MARPASYNRFVRWRRAGVWDRIMDALAAGHDAAVQMIDTSVVRVHQHGACIADNNQQDMGRSRGGLTSKIHAVADTTACRSISPSRQVRHTTIGCVRFPSARCSHKRCYSRIVDTTRTGSGSLSVSKGHAIRNLDICCEIRNKFLAPLRSGGYKK